jgi:hypothetical protein
MRAEGKCAQTTILKINRAALSRIWFETKKIVAQL